MKQFLQSQSITPPFENILGNMITDMCIYSMKLMNKNIISFYFSKANKYGWLPSNTSGGMAVGSW